MSTPHVHGLVSVVVPTYCREHYVLTTLESVFAQSYPAVEVIVVDDGSTDGTRERLAPLAEAGRIRYVWKQNGGLASARNAGAAVARGEYLTFLDDDDLWPSDALEWQVGVLEADPTLDAVFGDHVPFAGDPPATPPPPHMLAHTKGVGGPKLIPWLSVFACNPVAMGAGLLRRYVYEAVGGFDESLRMAEDYDFWFRVLERFRALQIPRLALYYRLHGGSMTRDVSRHAEIVMRVVERHHPRAAPQQRTAARFIGYSNLAAWYTPPLWENVRTSLRQRNWSTAARCLRTMARLGGRRVLASVLLKVTLLRQRRWRMDHADPVYQAAYPQVTPGGSPVSRAEVEPVNNARG